MEYSAGEEYRPKAGHVILSPFWIQFNSHTQDFSSERGKTRWAYHLSEAHSTLVEHGGIVGKRTYYNFPCRFLSRRLRTRKTYGKDKIPSLCHEYHACFLNLSIAALDPIDRVQPRSRINVCWMVGKIQRSCHHPCSMSFCAEPPSIWSPGTISSVTGQTNRLIPRPWPYPTSLGVSEAENPD